LRLKYYEQGREAFQGDTIDFGWLDEECDEDIYLEMLTRTNATKGIVCMSFTPLKGMSVVVRRFLQGSSPDRSDTNMTIDDVLHIAPEERQRIIDSYPQHERDARIRGEPMLGSGAIFPIADEDIMCDPFPMEMVPFYWQEIGGLDFGWDHPTAAVRLLYNTQDDIIYVTNAYRRREATPLQHASALKAWGKVPFAWPHDGLQHDKGSGTPLKDIYREQGLNMLSENARFEDGSNGVEAGIAEMLMRMETGRFKVFSHLTEWFEEKRMYHRREGKIWKEFDDLMAATRYAVMCLRFAKRVSSAKGKMGFNAIEDSVPYDSYCDPNYQPLGRDYVSLLLTGKT
jgi:phage terminase large subunit-like protein